jgi:orotidine-5'-phosphate decarboxylase
MSAKQNINLGIKNPLCLSLDCNDLKTAEALLNQIDVPLGCIKVGPRLILREGPTAVKSIKKYAPVFLDFKFYDIPSTTIEAVRGAFDLGATLVTVHASLGAVALRELAQLEDELSKHRPFKILAVTVLTSYAQQSLPAMWQQKPIEQLIQGFAKEVIDSGLTGLVCSPLEAASLRSHFPSSFLVTPGVRLAGAKVDDQSRVSTPKQAMQNGADLLVIGRPILESKNPSLAVKEILESLA